MERAVIGVAIDSIDAPVPSDVRKDYLRSYDGESFVESMGYVRNYPRDLHILATRLPDIKIPVLILGGLHDGFVPGANSEYLLENLPNSRLQLFNSGHFLWEEQPARYAHAISDWVTAGYKQLA